ncbi:MAG: hypothetical protein NTV54_09400 [Ignavibacteriales bacterium]|nr:hypothetical protein [Ignavibacteriales bacterium]
MKRIPLFLFGVCLCAIQSCVPIYKYAQISEESNFRFRYRGDVIVTVNTPRKMSVDVSKRLLLIFYALPNGNSTAWTVGKKRMPADDWHFDIQHIGAQTRFLRSIMPDNDVVVVYLEAARKSWPQWRSTHPDNAAVIRALIDTVASFYADRPADIMLSGHSGGGSLLFGYLNGVDTIPASIARIAFLDADYAYNDTLQHGEKLVQWLRNGSDHALNVLAYNDSIALLNGKPFVSATGGTWYRTKMMMRRLQQHFSFVVDSLDGLERFSALDGRIKIWMKENPERAIYHTVQVEKNGFIECVCSGSSHDGKGYTYFGDRAYTQYITDDSLAIQQ